MSDFLTNIATRHAGPAEVIKPRVPSLFEPRRATEGVLAGSAFGRQQLHDDQAAEHESKPAVSAVPPKSNTRATISESGQGDKVDAEAQSGWPNLKTQPGEGDRKNVETHPSTTPSITQLGQRERRDIETRQITMDATGQSILAEQGNDLPGPVSDRGTLNSGRSHLEGPPAPEFSSPIARTQPQDRPEVSQMFVVASDSQQTQPQRAQGSPELVSQQVSPIELDTIRPVSFDVERKLIVPAVSLESGGRDKIGPGYQKSRQPIEGAADQPRRGNNEIVPALRSQPTAYIDLPSRQLISRDAMGTVADPRQQQSFKHTPAATANLDRETEPIINVTIGRLEIKAITEQAPKPKAKNAPPIMSLDEYLERRTKRGKR